MCQSTVLLYAVTVIYPIYCMIYSITILHFYIIVPPVNVHYSQQSSRCILSLTLFPIAQYSLLPYSFIYMPCSYQSTCHPWRRPMQWSATSSVEAWRTIRINSGVLVRMLHWDSWICRTGKWRSRTKANVCIQSYRVLFEGIGATVWSTALTPRLST